MDFRILGPVEAVADGTPAPVRGRPLTLLALLLIQRGSVVARDLAVEALWGERPPGNPRNALQVVASRLRALLGDDVLEHRAGGYAVALAPGALDADRFEALVERGRLETAAGDHAAAAATLRAALGLWRGPALADVRDEDFAQPELRRLEELRLSALESRVEADLALGEGAALVGELRALVAAQPLRERLQAALMVALYRAGRQADALDVYRDARTALADGLGLEPSAELRRVERAILLQHDPAPAAAAGTAGRRALPLAQTPLVGRTAELAETTALLLRAGRLLTLTGPGGTGKTRLGIEVADGVGSFFADGVVFVPLAPVRDAAEVAGAVAGAIAAAEGEALGDAAAALPRLAAGRRLLVLLDNAEHVRDGVAAVVRALLSVEGPRVLVTSRVRLGLDGETVYEVPPLAPADGVTLFVARARRQDPAFAADAVVAELCARLDWLPLALELAAARSTLFSPQQLLERLGQRLDLFDGGPSADPRQRTLRATAEWSIALLDDAQLRLFRRLSVFAADAPWEAVEPVCAAAPDDLAALVDRCLVRRRVGQDGRPRFGMLETLRQFAAGLLAGDPAEQAACRRRHAELAAARAESLLASGAPAPVLALEAERPELLLALASAREDADPELELRLVAALHKLWRLRGPYADGVAAIEAALTRPGGSGAARARALLALADLVSLHGDNARGLELARLARDAARACGDGRTEAQAVNLLGNAAFGTGDLPAAIEFYREGIEVLRPDGISPDLLAPLANLGHALLDHGDRAGARETLEECVAQAATIGDRQRTSACMHSLGVLAMVDGRPGEAVELLAAGLELARELGLAKYQIDILSVLGAALIAAGDADEGVRVLGSADARGLAMGMPAGPEGVAERRVREHAVRSAMRELGPARYAAAHADGRAWSLDAAVRRALTRAPA